MKSKETMNFMCDKTQIRKINSLFAYIVERHLIYIYPLKQIIKNETALELHFAFEANSRYGNYLNFSNNKS